MFSHKRAMLGMLIFFTLIVLAIGWVGFCVHVSNSSPWGFVMFISPVLVLTLYNLYRSAGEKRTYIAFESLVKRKRKKR